MGMGDHIVHNGMVRKIAQDYPEYQICLGTKRHYWENVKYMYRDNPQISVINVGDRSEEHTSELQSHLNRMPSSA